MVINIDRHTWLVVIFCLYFNLTGAVAASEEEGLSEGTVIALACLFGAIFVGLVLFLTCFLVRRYRRKQFLKRRKEAELLDSINRDFTDSLRSSEIYPSKKMTLLLNGPVPTGGASVQKFTDWARHHPEPSPMLYTKRVHEVHPAERQHFTQRVFTVPTKTKTVITQRPKYIIRQNRTRSAPPPIDRHGFTKAHFLPGRGYVVANGGYHGNTNITRRVITQPPWRQEVIRQEVIRPPPVQEVIRPPPVQYIETVSPGQAPLPVPVSPPVQTIRHSAGEDTYHIKLNTDTMNYSKQKVGGSSSNILETSTYGERTYTDPDYVISSRSSAYKPTVLQGNYYQIPQGQETSLGWRVIEGGGDADSYRVSGNWAKQETELKTQTAEFHHEDDDAIFIQESHEPETVQVDTNPIVQKRTYEEVVIVDYVDSNNTQKVPPLSTSTPRFPEHEVSPIDDVLHGESSGTSSSSESDSGLSNENRRQRNPSSGS